MDSKTAIKRLKKDGWYLDRVNGSHHIFIHPTKRGRVIISHPKKDIPIGTWIAIQKAAGWK